MAKNSSWLFDVFDVFDLFGVHDVMQMRWKQ
jgi:hypothetical protein